MSVLELLAPSAQRLEFLLGIIVPAVRKKRVAFSDAARLRQIEGLSWGFTTIQRSTASNNLRPRGQNRPRYTPEAGDSFGKEDIWVDAFKEGRERQRGS